MALVLGHWAAEAQMLLSAASDESSRGSRATGLAFRNHEDPS